MLCGKPLIAWTIEAAQGSSLDAIIVSTDSPLIAKVAQKAGCAVPFLRPTELATDSAKTVDVLIHAVKWFEDSFVKPTHIVLLQPTSPLRRDLEIDHALGMVDIMPRPDSFVTMGEDLKPNGCLYITKYDMLMMDHRIWDLTGIMWVQPYPMIDVDTEEDLKEAERYLCLRSK